jgi:glycosyltransferase involved in cell wall biosynthesis
LKPRILFLVLSDYESLQRKGVLWMIYARDEQGFFERVVTVHPFAYTDQVIHLNAVHVIHEFGLRTCWSSTWRVVMLAPFLLLRLAAVAGKLIQIARAENIHLIRATDPYLMGLLAWLVSRATGLPFCVSIHTDYERHFALHPRQGVHRLMRDCLRWVPSFVLPRAKLVMPVRKNLLKQALATGISESATKYIPLGIDMRLLHTASRIDINHLFNIPEYAKILSFVGRLSKDNYIDDVVQMVEQLSEFRHDFVLIIVGGGEEEQRLQEWLARRTSLRRLIRLTGFQPYQIGLAVRQNSHVGICLMGGHSLIEACAAGRPVIAYDVDWHAEFVQDRVTGFLIPEHDISGLNQAVCFLLDHPEAATAMGQRAKKLACNQYNLDTTSRIKRDCYLELLAGHSSLQYET